LGDSIVFCPLLLLLSGVFLKPLFQDVVLFLYLMFVSIDGSLPVHRVFELAIHFKILEVLLVLHLKIVLGKLLKKVNYKCSLRFILFQHAKYELF
jgi:hypothetical protein